MLCARRVEKLEATAEAIGAAGGQALVQRMDVSDPDSIEAAFKALDGGPPATILVNNAGISSFPMLLDMSVEEWDGVQNTNLRGAWLVARAAARRMIEQGEGGSVINIASILGVATQKGTGAYAVSKAGLLHLTRCMAQEWARYDIRCNAIAPGYFRTEMAEDFLDSESGQSLIRRIPQRRIGDMDDLSGALLLLASDASSHMTGVTLTIDGGDSIPRT